MYTSDSIFTIGADHTICDEYARDGQIPKSDRAFAIVSDGCSSSPDTDLGARFLTLALIRELTRFYELSSVYPNLLSVLRNVIHKAHENCFEPLSADCLDATLLLAYEQEDRKVCVAVSGDGVILARTRTGAIHSWELDAGNAPLYLSYILNKEKFEEYLKLGHGKLTVTHRVDNHIVAQSELQLGWYDLYYQLEFDPQEYDLVMLLSDGVLSFRGADQIQVSLHSVLLRLLDNIGTDKVFLRKQCHEFLDWICPKLGWQHTDDFSAAAILLKSSQV